MYMCINTHVDTGTYLPTLPISTILQIHTLPTNKVSNTRLEGTEPRRRSGMLYSQVGLLGSGSAQYVDLPL